MLSKNALIGSPHPRPGENHCNEVAKPIRADAYTFLFQERFEVLGLILGKNNLGKVKSISSFGQLWIEWLPEAPASPANSRLCGFSHIHHFTQDSTTPYGPQGEVQDRGGALMPTVQPKHAFLA